VILERLFRKRNRNGDTSSAIVVNTLEGELMGFILTRFPVVPSHDGTYEGTCVFLIMPQDAALLDIPLCDRLYSYKDYGEHRVSLTITSGKREYTVFGSDLPVLRISADEQGQGTLIHKGRKDEPIAKIICLPPESKGVA
jgi:hypothetical protein